jgi:transcriptional regulator CtsR
MARLSDTIEEFIKSLIQSSDESELQIRRNELASHFSCAPSQINYVLTTRFTCDKGYHIESRRGGGGYIVIKRIEGGTRRSLLDSINESIGDNLTYDRGVQIIEGLFELNIVSYREGKIMKAAINDRALSIYENRNKVRTDILKGMIMVVMQ